MALRQLAGNLRPCPEVGSEAAASDADRDHCGGVFEHLPVQSRAQGLLPAAGYGTAQWLGSGGTRHLVPGHERQDGTVRENRAEGPGSRYSGWVRGWGLGDESGPVLRHAEAAGEARPMQDPPLLEPLLP